MAPQGLLWVEWPAAQVVFESRVLSLQKVIYFAFKNIDSLQEKQFPWGWLLSTRYAVCVCGRICADLQWKTRGSIPLAFVYPSKEPRGFDMYANQKQELEGDIVLPAFTESVPGHVKPTHRKAASLTTLRIAIAVVAVLGLIFLTTACFRRTRARSQGSASRRKLAEFPDGKGPPGNQGGNDDEPCEGKDTEDNPGEPSHVSQGGSETSGTQETGGSSTERSPEPAPPSPPRKRKAKTKHLTSMEGNAEGAGQVSEGAREGPSTGESGEPASASTAPRKRKAKKKHLESTAPDEEPPAKRHADPTAVQPAGGPLHPAASAIERLTVLCEALSVGLSQADELFDRGGADDRGICWLISLLEREIRRSLGLCRALVQDAAVQLPAEDLGMMLVQLDTADGLVERARQLISEQGILSTSGASDDELQPSDYGLLLVLITTGTHIKGLRSALEKHQKDQSNSTEAKLVDIYHKARDAVTDSRAFLKTLIGPMLKSARKLLGEQIARLSSLVNEASKALTPAKPQKGSQQKLEVPLLSEQISTLAGLLETASALVAAEFGGHGEEPGGQGGLDTNPMLELAKQQALASAQQVGAKLRQLREAVVSVSTAYAGTSSPAAQVAMSSLDVQARKQVEIANILIDSGLLPESMAVALSAQTADLEEALAIAIALLY